MPRAILRRNVATLSPQNAAAVRASSCSGHGIRLVVSAFIRVPAPTCAYWLGRAGNSAVRVRLSLLSVHLSLPLAQTKLGVRRTGDGCRDLKNVRASDHRTAVHVGRTGKTIFAVSFLTSRFRTVDSRSAKAQLTCFDELAARITAGTPTARARYARDACTLGGRQRYHASRGRLHHAGRTTTDSATADPHVRSALQAWADSSRPRQRTTWARRRTAERNRSPGEGSWLWPFVCLSAAN